MRASSSHGRDPQSGHRTQARDWVFDPKPSLRVHAKRDVKSSHRAFHRRALGSGRDLAAWLGLVPRQFTTGGKPKLLGISKRGNKYLRRQLIHGARAALPYVAERDTPLGRWAKGLASRAHRNVAIVAFANKLARIAWAVLRRGERFAVTGMPVAA